VVASAELGRVAERFGQRLRQVVDRFRGELPLLAPVSRSPHWYDLGGWLPPGVTLTGGHALINMTGEFERVIGRRVVPPPAVRSGGTVIVHEGAFQVVLNGPVDAATLPMVRRELNDAFGEFARLLRVGEVA
jgi:hypothetical protein